MNKISKFIVKSYIPILIIGLLLLIPSIIGYINTRINYDILVYLPEDIETIQGQNILTKDFGIGSYAFVMVDSSNSKYILNLENKIKKIDKVNTVFSVEDIKDVGIPKDMLPNEILEKIYDKKTNETMIMVLFDESTSKDSSLNGITELREIVKDSTKISSMTAMVLDTKNLSDQEVVTYVLIAVILVLIVLTISTDSYIIPFLLLGNIGIAILYNLGSNIIFGQISYITLAIAAILQLGVTTDFSIFLYNQYKLFKKDNNKKEAMELAIKETFSSILGSSLTTFAGFLALCTMQLTLGKDIGLVMAKGIVCGLITVLTILPALLLICDKLIEKTKHKVLLPKFKFLQKISINNTKKILVVFLLLLIPVIYGYKNYKVYYKLDDSLPKDLPFNIANQKLKDEFNIISPSIILLDKNIPNYKVKELTEKLNNIDGIDLVLSPYNSMNSGIINMIPESLKNKVVSNKYQLIIYNSEYEIATNKLNSQIETVNDLVKSYDKDSIVAGEGALMKDLVKISDHDLKTVNYTSIAVIIIIMFVVLKSIALPIILILAIEFAIFTNLSIAFYTNTSLPFVASIVVGTIQLGATIDYAILMSNTYIKTRKEYKNKKEAMKKTLELTTPSIITSALCFFAATIGVGIYTKIDMIGSICSLLSRGSIISMLVVILLLPSLLLIFDKLIEKTTKGGFKK